MHWVCFLIISLLFSLSVQVQNYLQKRYLSPRFGLLGIHLGPRCTHSPIPMGKGGVRSNSGSKGRPSTSQVYKGNRQAVRPLRPVHFTHRCVTNGVSTDSTPMGAISQNQWPNCLEVTCNYLVGTVTYHFFRASKINSCVPVSLTEKIKG